MNKRRNDMKENSNSSSSIVMSSSASNEPSVVYSSSNASSAIESKSINIDYELLNKHELFLHAFEKPTQIYRFLRTRHTFSPCFLHRNLTYMKNRMSRSNRKRANFRVDCMLANLIEKKSIDSYSEKRISNIDLQIAGIFDKSIDTKSVINVSITIFQEQKVLDPNQASNEIHVGDFRVPLNPKENSKSATHVRLLKEHLTSSGKHLLVFTASLPRPAKELSLETCVTTRNSDEGALKRRKGSMELRKFRAELLLFSKNHENMLKDGEYHVVFNDCATKSQTLQQSVQEKFKKVIFWDQSVQANGLTTKDISHEPCVSFFLLWSNETNESSNNHSLKSFHWKSAQPLKQIEPLNGDCRPKPDLKLNPFHLHAANGHHQRKDTSVNVATSNANSLANRLASAETQPKVIYRFMYNQKYLQQTKASDNVCPWCNLHCFHFVSLRQHLKFCHSRFNFSFFEDKDGYKVDVTINDQYDGGFCGNPLFNRQNGLFKYSGPTQRVPVSHVLINLRGGVRRKLNELLEETLESELIKPFVYGHNRLYYHSGTCQPIRPHELDVDSEDETDPEWMRIKTQLMIDEFTDVNEGEKEVMKLWNLHMMKHNFVGECHVPLACELFLDQNWTEIIKRNIYKNFILHLNNLFDYGLLSSSEFRSIIQKFHQLKANNPKLTQKALQDQIRF